MAYIAAIFLEHQTLHQRSLAWKMATSSTHPLLTKSIHGGQSGSIEMLDASTGDKVSIQAIWQWCALHKSDKHSHSDCRNQQDVTSSSSAKKQPTNAKEGSKPHRLRFKWSNDKKKFLRSIGEMVGISFEDSSNDENVIEQSLVQLHASPVAEGSEDDNSPLVNLHILVLEPVSFDETDVIMEEGDLPNHALQPFDSYSLLPTIATVDSAVSHLHLEGESNTSLYDVVEHLINDFSASSHSSITLLDRPDPSVPILSLKLEDNSHSPDPHPVEAELYPSLPSPQDPSPATATVPLPYGPVLINGVYYQPILAPHDVVVANSSVPAPTIVPCTKIAMASQLASAVFSDEPTASTNTSSSQLTIPAAKSKPPVGLEFVMPESPPNKKPVKGSKKVPNWSRSSSRTQSTSGSRSSSHRRKRKSSTKATLKPQVRPTNRGHWKKKVEMSNAPLVLPTTHSHLLNIAKPMAGLTISFTTDDSSSWMVQATLTVAQHLSKLMTKTSAPLEDTSTLTVKFKA